MATNKAKKPTPTPQAAAVKTLEASVAANQKTVEKAVKAGQKAAVESLEKAVTLTKAQSAKASDSAVKSYEDLSGVSKATVEAYVQSGSIAAKGMESIGKEVMSFAQTALEANLAAVQAAFKAGTLEELFEIQSKQAQKSFDDFVAESAKLTDLSVSVANEAAAPIQKRVNETVETLLKPIAA